MSRSDKHDGADPVTPPRVPRGLLDLLTNRYSRHLPAHVIRRTRGARYVAMGIAAVYVISVLAVLWKIFWWVVQKAWMAAAVPDWTPLAMALAALCSVIGAWWVRRSIRRCFARETGGHEYCLECSYSLAGLPAQGRCPECGTSYDIEEVRRTWKSLADA